MSEGYVYILTNPSMPGLVKIGKTTRSPEDRANEIYQTGVPTPFEVADYVFSPDCGDLESTMHRKLASSRVSESREFFRADLHFLTDELQRELESQVHRHCERYLPDHIVVWPDFIPSPDDVAQLAYSVEAHPAEMASAISLITKEEARVLLDRWQNLVEARSEARLRLVSDGGAK